MYQDHDASGGKPIELDDREVQELGVDERNVGGPVELHTGSPRRQELY